MNWFSFAISDWEVYHDSTRIRKFVEFGKITQEQYTEITDEPYV